MLTLKTSSERQLLRKALRYWGVQPDYTDAYKKTVRPRDGVLIQLLEAVSGLKVKTPRDLEDLVRLAREKKVKRILEPVTVFHEKRSQVVAAYLPPLAREKKWMWKIQLENGERIEENLTIPSNPGARAKFEIRTQLPVGYHQLEMCANEEVIARSFILCAPELKIRDSSGKKSWGVFAPLYGLRRDDNWGIGDLGDMEEFQAAIHKHGADFFGTLPLLASVSEGPDADPSPYSPVSRLFWNEVFLDVDILARESKAAQALIQSEDFQREQTRLRQLPLVDYVGVAKLKKSVLSILTDEFFKDQQNKSSAYQEFLKHSPSVDDYAKFRARGNERERDYHLYVQFQMDQGLKRLSERAKRGEAAGLYLDFPVGASRTGFDGERFAKSFLNELTSGAPPDLVFVGGQNWGFAPLHPHHLREDGYQYFIQCMRHHMRYAKILRLDHVMAFTRIYSIPVGVDPKSGGYIRYKSEEFFAVLAIEAARADAIVVGEDLGTVPASMRKALDENNCLGMWVLPFEAGNSPTAAAAEARPKSLACLNTHDMVPWAGFYGGHDLEIFEELKVLDHEQAETAREERRDTLKAWKNDVGVQKDAELLPKLLELMARSPAELFLLNIEDLWTEVEAQNVPGTWKEHPNWQRKLKRMTQEWILQPEVTGVMDQVSRWRQQESLKPPSKAAATVQVDSSLTPEDLYLFNEGRHHRAYLRMGAHPGEHKGEAGVWFSVWAPAVPAVWVIGDFNDWQGGQNPLKPQGDSGVWMGFVPGAKVSQTYKFQIQTQSGILIDKADPFAFEAEIPPRTASRIQDLKYQWKDDEWMQKRGKRQATDQAMSVYEMHLGSWRRKPEDGNRSLTYRELAEQLPAYLKELEFTHVQFMPVMEHPFYGSWGYQTTSYFAPSSRFGSPQDFMFLIDSLHQAGIGVLLDWVPSHFPEDAFALGQFNGTHLFEHEDPRLGFHPDWKSLIFNYGRHEVRSFLISSALFWLDRYHIDGLRVDAVASMLYLDYSRKAGEWVPNKFGGRENLEAIQFLREMNEAVYRDFPDVHTIAEESTAWPKVSAPVYAGGLGFGMKWDMGWMHDTLEYFKKDPIHRRHHQGQLAFRMHYAFNENFVLSISHDEVVYGKGSVLGKMSGDNWQKFANLRTLYAYMYAQPGKKLLFMGSEFAQEREWAHESSLDWHLLNQPGRETAIRDLVKSLNRLYREEAALHELDFSPEGFEWLDASDSANSVLSFYRKSKSGEKVLCIFNMTPVVRNNYRLGVEEPGRWREILNTDSAILGGSGVGNMGEVRTHPVPSHGRLNSLTLTLPPLAALYLKYQGRA